MTRLNVYAGPAGFWLIRGGPDDKVLDSRTGAKGALPGPAPRRGDRGTKRYREIPIVIQDRAFDRNGGLFYPDSRAFFDGVEGPYIPETDVSPIWNPEFFGNVMVVNGRSWPRLVTERRRYRFRLLNGCDSRFLILKFDDPGVRVWQIGTEGGFLPRPLNLNDVADGHILLALAERADVIADFSGVPAGTEVHLLNLGPDEPFGGGVPGEDFEPSDPGTTGQVMRFDIVAAASADTSTPPQYLKLPVLTDLTGGSTRKVSLLEEMSMDFDDAPVAALLGIVRNGHLEAKTWDDTITENPALGSTEVWEMFNATADAHPIHIHEVQFQVVNRQRLRLDDEGEVVQPVETVGTPRRREPWEAGFKDTVISYPGEVTRVRLKFQTAGNYVWHCHIVSHEDNEMMRPYRIGPLQPGSPEA
jgi:FtsP/CotA-like multicopper oxidase with cupredoxin domain